MVLVSHQDQIFTLQADFYFNFKLKKINNFFQVSKKRQQMHFRPYIFINIIKKLRLPYFSYEILFLLSEKSGMSKFEIIQLRKFLE